MKKNKIISFLLISVIILSYCSTIFASIEDADNGKMKYYKKYDYFDIKGYVNGQLQSTTFSDGGYNAYLIVDNNDSEKMRLSTDISEQKIHGIEWDIDCSFINNGRYVKIIYTLKNTNEVESTISLGGCADVQIAGNDYATLERFENSNGVKLYDINKNIQFSFYGKSVAGTTNIDNLWLGKYNNGTDDYYNNHCFENNTVNKVENSDSAFTFSWVNRKIAAGETKKYSVIIGMGEVSNAPKIELDENQGRCFSQDNVVINGTITDLDPNSKATLYYTVDNGEEKNQEEKPLTNNKLKIELNLNSNNLAVGTHNIKLWAIDESGNPSEVLEKEILITNLKAPTINMSEEWSKDPVKFTITDDKNNSSDVEKYQYKIGNGSWQDVGLNTEVTALDNSGTVTVLAKVIGKTTDEQSSVVSKTAKVDKDGPIITVLEQDKKIAITTTDEQSGPDTLKYIFNNKKDLEENATYTEYSNPIDCTNVETEDLYLHVLATDKLGNQSTFLKEYKKPTPITITTKETFIEKNPTFKLTDEKNQAENGYKYQIKVNDGEWQNINVNTEYTIDKPVSGTNTIKTRTIDPLGRISSETEVKTTYSKDTTIANGLLPKTGLGRAIMSLIVVSFMGITGYIGYKKFKFVK